MFICLNQCRLTSSLVSKVYEVKIYLSAINEFDVGRKFGEDFIADQLMVKVEAHSAKYGYGDLDMTRPFRDDLFVILNCLHDDAFGAQMMNLLDDFYDSFLSYQQLDGFRFP